MTRSCILTKTYVFAVTHICKTQECVIMITSKYAPKNTRKLPHFLQYGLIIFCNLHSHVLYILHLFPISNDRLLCLQYNRPHLKWAVKGERSRM